MACPDHLPFLQVTVSEIQTSGYGTVAFMYPVAEPPSGIVPSGVSQLRLPEVFAGATSKEGDFVGSVNVVVDGAPGAGAAFCPEISESAPV